jgi:IS30 family transposase
MEGLKCEKAVLVIADRKSRSINLSIVNRKSKSVQQSTHRCAKSQQIRIKSITNDNGYEFYPKSITRSERLLKAEIFY